MAIVYKSKTGFVVIKLTNKETEDLDFGVLTEEYGHICICNSCNSIICDDCDDILHNDAFYLPILNEVFCYDCMDDIINNTLYSGSDASIDYEERHAKYVVDKLKKKGYEVEEVDEEPSNN